MSNVGVQNDSNKMHMHVYSTSVTGALSDAGASIKRGTSRSLPVAVQLGPKRITVVLQLLTFTSRGCEAYPLFFVCQPQKPVPVYPIFGPIIPHHLAQTMAMVGATVLNVQIVNPSTKVLGKRTREDEISEHQIILNCALSRF